MPPDGVEFLPVGATRPGLADWQPATARADTSIAVMVKAFMDVSRDVPTLQRPGNERFMPFGSVAFKGLRGPLVPEGGLASAGGLSAGSGSMAVGVIARTPAGSASHADER